MAASTAPAIGSCEAQAQQIPEEFMVNFKGNVPHRIIIETVMTKKCWRVDAEKDEDGRVYFGEGWSDFIEAHSLEVGSFLVFEYEEQSIFQVKIYGKNGCEKTAFGGTQLGLHKPEKTIKYEEIEDSECNEPEGKILEKRQRKTTRLSPYGHGIYKKHGLDRTYVKATEVFISENTIGFSTSLHKKKRHQFIRLIIPKAVTVAKKLSSMEEVILQVAEGDCWPVKLLHRRDKCSSYFYTGWKKFLEDNNIVGGDKLSFEFVSGNVIQVRVMRNAHVKHQSGNEASGLLNVDGKGDKPVTRITNDKEIEASITKKRSFSDFKSCSFSITWTDSTTGGYLHIPKAVVEDQNLKSKDKVVIRDPEGKCWPLDVRNWYDGRVALTKGWREFWRGHEITAGDSLYFEFISECLIQVTIEKRELTLKPVKGACKNPEAQDNSGRATAEGAPDHPEETGNGGDGSQQDEVDAIISELLGTA